MGRDATVDTSGTGRMSFNPRARVGRDLTKPMLDMEEVCFNPRARVGRDGLGIIQGAQAKGFNPRARVGRDLITTRRKTVIIAFQSTRPRGARPMDRLKVVETGCVSIHAPAWGATQWR